MDDQEKEARCEVVRLMLPQVYFACQLDKENQDIMCKLADTCICYQNNEVEYPILLDLILNGDDRYTKVQLERKARMTESQIRRLLK